MQIAKLLTKKTKNLEKNILINIDSNKNIDFMP